MGICYFGTADLTRSAVWMTGYYWLGWEWSWCVLHIRWRRGATVSQEARLQSHCSCSSGMCFCLFLHHHDTNDFIPTLVIHNQLTFYLWTSVQSYLGRSYLLCSLIVALKLTLQCHMSSFWVVQGLLCSVVYPGCRRWLSVFPEEEGKLHILWVKAVYHIRS